MYLAETGARKYAREHGDGEASWSKMFPKDVRLAVSREWRNEFEQESALGNYDNETYLPKKYLQKLRSDKPTIAVGTRVQTHPATNAWMRGDRYGTIEGTRGNKLAVRLDRSNKISYFTVENLIPAD